VRLTERLTGPSPTLSANRDKAETKGERSDRDDIRDLAILVIQQPAPSADLRNKRQRGKPPRGDKNLLDPYALNIFVLISKIEVCTLHLLAIGARETHATNTDQLIHIIHY
jgi:hypothetical protein